MKYLDTYRIIKKAELNLQAPFRGKVQGYREPPLYFGMPKQRLKWKLKGLQGKELSDKYKEISRNYIKYILRGSFPTLDSNSPVWKRLAQPIPSFKSLQKL